MGRLTMLKQIAADVASQFGPDCEVVIHDIKTKDPKHSIIHIINGHVTNRTTGDGLSSTVCDTLRKLSSGTVPKDRAGYLVKTPEGKILKCSTSYLCDDDGTLHYIFGINYDITKLTIVDSALHDLLTSETEKQKPRHSTHNVNDLLEHLIEESVELVGKPVALMNKDDKVTAIQYLNDAGAFLITKSGDKVAHYFGISKYTLYSYIDVNK